MILFVLIILFLLVLLSLRKGYSLREIAQMALPGIRGSLIVVEVLLLIGCLTGLWRACGTVAYFIVGGLQVVPPSLFVLAAFLLTAVMSLAIGTSFGVVSTAGVILMSIAKAAGIDPLPVAGAVMSGIYVGDRNSPAASSATLVASVTGTDLEDNVKKMFRISILPLCLCLLAYALLSFRYPMQQLEAGAVVMLRSRFLLHPVCLVPAVLMILLPLCGVNVKLSMFLDILLSAGIGVFVQKLPLLTVLRSMVLGYRGATEELDALLGGGGISSMLSVCFILLVSGSFSDILDATGMLEETYGLIDRIRKRAGRFPTMILLSLLSCMLFCNQTIGVLMTDRLSSRLYDPEKEKTQKMLDIEDSVILLAGAVPWCIACSVPLSTLEVGAGALLYSFYLWLMPLWHLIREGKTHEQV